MEHRHAPLALLAALVMPFAAVPASAQVTTASRAEAASTQFELTVPSIMRGPELVGETPLGVQWSDDSRWVYFRWKPGGRPWHEPLALYRVRADGGTPERLSDAAADSLGVILASGSLSTDERYRAVSYQGDI
jgi:hypothetical protein